VVREQEYIEGKRIYLRSRPSDPSSIRVFGSRVSLVARERKMDRGGLVSAWKSKKRRWRREKKDELRARASRKTLARKVRELVVEASICTTDRIKREGENTRVSL
jgi:hypothetical protein